jgi:uncharacterized protein (DUF4415 family)
MPTGKKTTEAQTAGTDWKRVKHEAAAEAPVPYDRATDAEVEPYDPNDAAAGAAHWAASTIKRSPGRPRRANVRPALNMRVDADVLDAFKATGPGWQTRIHALLRDAVARGKVKGD